VAISILRPYALVLIPILILFVLLTSRNLDRIHKRKKRAVVIIRNIIFTLLILSMSGILVRWSTNTVTTILAVDMSDSMSGSRVLVDDFMKGALDSKPGNELMGIVAFGDNTQVETFVSKNPSFKGFEGAINGSGTNIENAFASAISLFPEGTKKRIVLVTDGQENTGSSQKFASTIIDMGVDLKIYRIEKDIKNEAALESINIPQTLDAGETFSIVVNVSSKIKTRALLTLYNGREKAFEKQVDLQKGSNRFVFKDTASGSGFRVYRATIQPESDTITQNNEVSAITSIQDKSRILVIEDTPGESREIVNMLKASNADYRLADASSAPSNLSDMSAYKTIITCNVSAENLNDGFVKSLDSYVKDFGGGFIAAGGENSFALGGYFKTSLEKVLPVSMELKGKKQIPDMAIMLIIDKSDSMSEGSSGITKVDIAKEAAGRVLDSLRTGRDEIGVIAFDDTVYKVVERKKIDSADNIRSDIGTIRSSGGTSILPALDEGYNEIKNSTAKIKHIILLTDGQAEKTGYDALIGKIKKDGITVSTVAVGQGSDAQLLEAISRTTGGRYYYTDEASNVPTIFAKETFMAANAYINNKPFTPTVVNPDAILQGVSEGGFPQLLGYVASTPKDSAKVILSSSEDDPILTVWQYGLGKTAAWNSDISGRWSANYVTWNKNIRLWQNLIDWTIGDYKVQDASVEASLDGSRGTVTYTNMKGGGELETIATIVAPDMDKAEIPLLPIAPGKYSSPFDANKTGVYMINVKQVKDGQVVSTASCGLPVQYSPEYRIDSDTAAIDRLVNGAGGKYIKKSEDIYKGDIKGVIGQVDITPYLLLLALLLFMADITLRRLNISLYMVKHRLGKLNKTSPHAEKAVPRRNVKAPVIQEKKVPLQQLKREAAAKRQYTKKKDVPKPQSLDLDMLLENKETKYR
jgi:uncharacterized membrane protein